MKNNYLYVKLTAIIALLVITFSAFGQTAPTAQSLPFTTDFGTTTFTTAPAGFAVWNGVSGGSVNTQALAEASSPTGNAPITAAIASQTGGGAYGYAISSNARIYIQASSNTTNGVNQVVFAINTGSATTINVAYDIEVVNNGGGTGSTGSIGSVLQYRAGTTGTWTSVAASVNIAAGTISVGSLASVNTSISGLSANTDYQFRLAHWRVTGGNSKGLAYDNFNITAVSSAPPVIQNTPLTALTGNYGTAITPYTVTATNSPISWSAANLPAGLSISNTGVITGTPTAVSSPSVTIDASNAAGTGSASLSVIISPKNLTITGLTANNKTFDGSTTATLSGTPSLVGIVGSDVVTLSGTPTANFNNATIGTGKPVTVTGYTITGADAAKYTLTQPTGLTADITGSPVPVITNAGNLITGVYGSAISTYTVTATNSPTSFGATGLPAGLSINTSTGEITGTPTVVGSFSPTVTASNAGGASTPFGLNIMIDPATLTLSGASASNKAYDGTDIAVISGSVTGLIGSDNVTFNGTGTFASVNVGTAITVTSTSTITGADAAKYTLTQPTGLIADITLASQTINFTLTSPITTATTTVNLTGTATSSLPVSYASSNTSVATVSGSVITIVGVGTTDITADQVGNSNYNAATSVIQTLVVAAAPTLTDVIVPQYMQGLNVTNNTRVPTAFRATINNLIPNATYRYNVGFELASAAPSNTSFGAGIGLFPGSSSTSSFILASTQSLGTANQYGTFNTDATGSYTGWFAGLSSGNATRFIPGNILVGKIVLNNGAGGTTGVTGLTTTNTIKVINFGTGTTANEGTAIYGSSAGTDKNFVCLYDNTGGTGRPIATTLIESDGVTLPTTGASATAVYYSTNVDGQAGKWGTIIPNILTSGIRRVEQRDFATGAIVGCPGIDADGSWASGANTINPAGGTTAIALSMSDAPFNSGTPILNVGAATGLTEQCTDGAGWVHYGDNNGYYFAIHKTGNTFSPTNVNISYVTSPIQSTLVTAGTNQHHQMFLMGRGWNVDCAGCTIATPVAVRFYYDPAELTDALNARDNAFASLTTTSVTNGNTAEWFKTIGVPYDATFTGAITGNIFPSTILKFNTATNTATVSSINANLSVVELTGISSFSGGSAGFSFGVPTGGANGLPVTWSSVSVSGFERGHRVLWATASEWNTSYFEVEASADAKIFKTVSTKISAAGYSQTMQDYSFINTNSENLRYYRVRQVDKDGRYSYSKIVEINQQSNQPKKDLEAFIYTSKSNEAELVVRNRQAATTSIEAVNLSGASIYKTISTLDNLREEDRMTLPEWSAGIYLIRVSNGQEIQTIRLAR